MSTPMNNLKQGGFEPSSVQPGVSGESRNAPYGPKAFESDDISSLKDWGDQHNVAKSGFAVGGVGNLCQEKEVSSVNK